MSETKRRADSVYGENIGLVEKALHQGNTDDTIQGVTKRETTIKGLKTDEQRERERETHGSDKRRK